MGFDTLTNKLEEFSRKYYLSKLLKGLIYFSGIGLLYFLLLSGLEYFGRFNSSVRFFLLILLTIGITLISFYYVFLPLLGLFRIHRKLDYAQAARLIGEHFPRVDDKILNTLQLHELSNRDSELIKASINQKIQKLSDISFQNAVNLEENTKYWPILLIPVSIFLFLWLTGNLSSVTESGKRIVQYQQEFLPKAPFQFITDKEYIVERGEDLKLDLILNGDKVPSSVLIEYPEGESRMVSISPGQFNYVFENVQESFSFRYKASGFLSRVYDVKVIPVPKIKNMLIQVVPPQYTGLRLYISKTNNKFSVPEGSEVRWNLLAEETQQAHLITEDTAIAFKREGEQFSLSQKLKRDLSYRIDLQNDQFSKQGELSNTIAILKDQYPSIKVEYYQDTVYQNTIFIKGSLSDDYGFTDLQLCLIKKDVPKVKHLNINKKEPIQSFTHTLQLDPALTNESKSLSIYLKIYDNDEINGPKAAQSNRFQFKLKGAEEIEGDINRGYENIENERDRLEKLDEAIEKEIEALRKKLLRSKKLEYREQERLKELLQKEEELLKRRQELNKKIEKLQRKENKVSDKSEELQKKEKELIEIRNDNDQDKIEKLIEDIQKLMEKLDTEKLQEKLEALQKANEQNQRSSKRDKNLLEDLKFQKDVLRQSEKLEQLAKKQKKLSESDHPNEGKKQRQLAEELTKIQEEVEKLEKQNKFFKLENNKQELDKNFEDIQQQIEHSQKNMQKGQPMKANQNQKKASEKMQEMSRQLQQNLMNMQEQLMTEDMRDLRQILENLEILSHGVEGLAELSKSVSIDDPQLRAILTEQQKIKEGVKIIEDSLVALSERSTQIKEMVFKEMADVKTNLDKSIDELEERNSLQAAASQQYVMTAANNLAFFLDQSLRQMQQIMSVQMPGKQSCQKPKIGKSSLPNMRQLQQQLGEQISQLQQKGKKLTEQKKGGIDKGNNSPEIIKILSQQEQLRNQLQELNEKISNNDSKSNIQEAIKQMEELEKDLLSGQFEYTYKERLKEVEIRLLESEKAEMQQDQKEDRESKTSEEIRMEQSLIEKYIKEKNPFDEEILLTPLKLKNYYRQKANLLLNTAQP